MAQTQVFSCECCEFFKNSFFYTTPLVTAFNKEWGKIFKWKKKMKTFHLNSTCNYVNIRTAHSFSLTFSSNFLSFDSCMLIFVFSFLIKSKIYLVAFISIFRSRHWELFCPAAVGQDNLKQLGLWNSNLVFFKWLYSDVLGELKVPIAIQYQIKISRVATQINADQESFWFFF